MEKYNIKPRPLDYGIRIDAYLVEYFQGRHSRTYLQKLIADKCVFVNAKPCKQNYKIRENDEIEIAFPPIKPSIIQPQDIPIEIIYEDKDLLVVNKPAGMVTHPGAGVKNGTLVNALLHH